MAMSELEQANRKDLADMKQYREEVAACIEQKTSHIKKKLADYKGKVNEQWEPFNSACDREMNTLGEAFDEFTKRIS